MADFDDIDALLSNSLKSAAEPANSTGVADAIRSRVSAGDTGTSVAGSTAPGWGGGGGALAWLPVLGVVVAAGVVGGTLGALGYFGGPVETVAADPASANSAVSVSAPFASCPGGIEAGTLPAGVRVLAVSRDEDATHVGVRDPYDLASTIWLATPLVSFDDGQPQLGSLPVGDPCPIITESTPTPDPEPTTEPQPTNEPDPDPDPQPGDTTPPVVKPGSWSQGGVYGTGSAPYCAEYADIVVTIADNVGVTQITATQSHPGSSIQQIAHSGTSYTYRFTAGIYSYPSPDLNVTVTWTAKDAAGNTASNNKTITIYNTCLI